MTVKERALLVTKRLDEFIPQSLPAILIMTAHGSFFLPPY